MEEQQGVSAACLGPRSLAAAHCSFMCSHRGSAEQDAAGRGETSGGRRRKGDTVFYDLTGGFLSLADSHLAAGGRLTT